MSITEEQNIENYTRALIACDKGEMTNRQFCKERLKYFNIIREREEKEFPPEHFNDGVCKHCQWRSEFPHSHATQSMHKPCKFMKLNYKVYIDEDGEVVCEEK